MNTSHENESLNNGASDAVLSLSVGAAFANFAEAVSERGGDARILRERSIDSLEEALRERSDLWRVREKEGDLLQKLGRFEEAAHAYRTALRLASWNASLKEKYFRAKVLAAITAREDEGEGAGKRTGEKTRLLRARPTKPVTRKPKSARIRKYYRIGSISTGA